MEGLVDQRCTETWVKKNPDSRDRTWSRGGCRLGVHKTQAEGGGPERDGRITTVRKAEGDGGTNECSPL